MPEDPRIMFVVTRDQERLYENLLDAFVDATQARVILDRRVRERRGDDRRPAHPERRGADRRVRPEIQSHLHDLGWAVVRLR